ncbi:MAG: signal peptidase I [Verrucomicrobia bacterium]|nr:MAG: signal peptidase I [Verrucomicrobiota bacterium]
MLAFLLSRNCRSVRITTVQSEANKHFAMEVTSWWGRILVGRRPARTLARLVALIVVSFVLFKFLFIPIRVVGNSMAPTYHNGRINLINRLAYHWHAPRRGDVVAVRQEGTYTVLLKRIVGMPGERIEIRRGSVIVNGIPLIEPYARGRDIPPRNEFHLRDDEYFVIGDNRDVSVCFPVYRNDIIGKAVL